jgi:hypothetical protein
MNPQFAWRDLVNTAVNHEARATEPEILLRQVQRLRALGRTPDDTATLLGMNPADVRLLIFGLDDPGSV